MKASTLVSAYTSDVEGGNIQTIPVPGCVGVPVGARVIVSSGVTAGTRRDHMRIGLGYFDGTNYRAASAGAEDNLIATANDSFNRYDTASIIVLCGETSSAQDAKATCSLASGGVVLTWSDFPAVAVLLHVTVYFGGAQVALYNLDGSASVGGTATKTGLAFAPDALEVMHLNTLAWAADSTTLNARLGWGHAMLRADGTTITQVSHILFDRGNTTLNTATASDLRDDCVAKKIVLSAAGALTDGARLDVTSFTSDGHVFTTRAVAESIRTATFAIRYGSGDRWCGIPSTANLDTSTTGQQAQTIPSPSFRPVHADCIGTGNAAKNGTTGATLKVSFGGGRPADQGCAGVASEDAVLTTNTESVGDDAIANVPSLAADDWVATLDSFSSSGWTPNVTTASAAARVSAWALVGGQPDSGHLPRQHNRWRRQLARM